jgi:hypothetical protein
VTLTNEQVNFDVGYPRVSDRFIAARQADLIGLSNMHNVVATELYKGILQWFEKIKSTVDAQAHSLQDVVDNFYLLGLYPYYRRIVLHNLTRLTQAAQWDESVALGEAISQFDPDRCAKAILNMQSSLPLTELVARLSARYRSFEKIRAKLPSVFNFLVLYLIAKDAAGVGKLHQDCLQANKVVAEFSAGNQTLLEELILLNDFTASLPQDAPIIAQIRVFKQFNKIVTDYQAAVANLEYLSDQSYEGVKANCNEPEKQLAVMVQATWTVMASANNLVKKVIGGIESANNNEIVAQAESWRAMLGEQTNTCARKIGELKILLGLEGVGVDVLRRCRPELREVAYVALPMAIRHLDSVVEKMQGLRARLLPPDCGDGPSKHPFSCQ